VLDGVWIYSNTLRRTGWDAINVKGAPRQCFVYSNEIYENSTAGNSNQEGGVSIGLNAHCDVYNNFIKDGYSRAIKSSGIGGKIYNNVIVNPGRDYSRTDNRGSGIHIFSGTSNKDYCIWNNTIVDPKSYGIRFDYASYNSRIENNIIVNPGGFGSLGDSSYIYLPSQADATVSYNVKSRSTYQVDFVNPNADNYSLYSTSPAIDSGTDLSSQGITFDFIGTRRPQGGRFDIGAYER
jgi:hypothetical protein